MSSSSRGAHAVVAALEAGGVEFLATLSGNQIMPVFDACIDSRLRLVHVRHEAAAVHMADAWGRLTQRPGVALVTAGPGLANCPSALYVARMAESPLVLLSGDAPLAEQGRGAFQEMAQVEMTRQVTKEAWKVGEPRQIAGDVQRALAIAASGRPGPVHLSLPFDVLQATLSQTTPAAPPAYQGAGLPRQQARGFLAALADAERPLVLVGPSLMRGQATDVLSELQRTTSIPVVGMESPRGVNDPNLGAFAEVLEKADLILLLAKKLDFSLQQNNQPAHHPNCRFLQIDPDADVLQLTERVLDDPSKLVRAACVDPLLSAAELLQSARYREWPERQWLEEVQAAVAYRPAEWARLGGKQPGGLHPVELCRATQDFLDQDRESVFVSDGGEFGQWAQACLTATDRVINGPAGAIGSGLPFAMAARLARPQARIVVTLGDGTFGFHAMEYDTAVRERLPFIALVGNDAMWNAEHQIQLREYGAERTIGCELLPTRYDQLVTALGGHGAHITAASELPHALNEAHRSGLPSCLNVRIENAPAPIIRR